MPRQTSRSLVLLAACLCQSLRPPGAFAAPFSPSSPGPPAPPFNSTWLRSDANDTRLTLLPNGTLQWLSPKHFTGIFTYLSSPLPLAVTGDRVNLTARWRSSGTNACPASCYNHKENYCQSETCQAAKCASRSVSCLAGTGDFRIALLDTRAARGRVPGDNWCPGGRDYGVMTKCIESDPFSRMQGYDFRIFPHLTTEAKHEPGQVPCSIYKKEAANLFGKARLGEWGCFGTPLGEWTTLSLFIKRRANDRFEVGMSMNGIT